MTVQNKQPEGPTRGFTVTQLGAPGSFECRDAGSSAAPTESLPSCRLSPEGAHVSEINPTPNHRAGSDSALSVTHHRAGRDHRVTAPSATRPGLTSLATASRFESGSGRERRWPTGRQRTCPSCYVSTRSAVAGVVCFRIVSWADGRDCPVAVERVGSKGEHAVDRDPPGEGRVDARSDQ